ncbi:MAG TPA: inositol monophosphatase family protein [Vicinamibacteria bacterium]|nr:inositol monophosphatase family protein [Vicinamibacteria bacterium]
MDLKPVLDQALAAARAAGDILRADFHRVGGPRGQVDKAEADLEAERLIRSRLTSTFPHWGYLGEETGRHEGVSGAPRWLVDPNDGTRDYLEGRRGSAVSIGLLVDRRPVLGVVFAFAYPDDAGDLFAWAEGTGPLTRNQRPVVARLPVTLGAADVVLVSSKGDLDPRGNLACVAPARYRSVPSIAHRLALVAAGEAAAATSLFAPGAWDYAAGHALIRAAGGLLVNESGQEIVYGEDGSSRARRAFAGSGEVAIELARRPWEEVTTRGVLDLGSGLAPGRAVTEAGRLSRAQGCLLGQVAGDSLGGLVEFQGASEIAARHSDGPRLLADGGQWRLLAGQPTDDSELALALARSILANRGYSAEAALHAYRVWLASDPFDCGRTVRAALSGQPDPESQANGSLMRASPLGILAHAETPAETARLARQDAALTHPHPVCGDATAAYAIAIAHAVRAGDGPRAAFTAALDWARAEAAESVVGALARAPEQPPNAEGARTGWVLVALQNAFYELLHAPTLEEGVVASVRRGGDTDTNAAVTGALLGAVYGRNGVPPQWRSQVLSCRPMAGASPRPRPLACWATDALEIAEGLLLAGRACA